MNRISAVSVMGWSGSGKTTVLENLIPRLKKKGLRVGVLKHDGHKFKMDDDNKDTGRFTLAGADVTAISCETHAAVLENRPLSLAEMLARIRNVDIILVEGWKASGLSKIEVNRLGNEKPRYAASSDLTALVTDAQTSEESIPVFGLSDYDALAQFIYEHYLCGEFDLDADML